MASGTALRSALLAGIIAGSSMTNAYAGGFAAVTNGDDSGPGSLRDALEVQEASFVFINPAVTTINIDTTLEYSSEDQLFLIGTGQTIATVNNVTLLAVTEGANVSISNLDFEGPGGWSILNRGDQGADPAGKGIFVGVREDQTGIVNVVLTKVGVSGVANHGIHVSDCSLADDCGAGSGGGGDGSDAGVNIVCLYCTVDDVGNGKFDADGIRVDDRGEGNISAFFKGSSFTNVGADGVELDEGDGGSVILTSIANTYSNNGGYCDPSIIGPFIPDPDEVEFLLSDEVEIGDIPSDSPGSADDGCIEREVDFYPGDVFVEKYEFAIDLDDGIDLDEAGDGSLRAVMRRDVIDGNLDEGVDFDEAGEGNIHARYINTSATGNNDDGFKMTEEDNGGTFSQALRSSAIDNGGKGFVFEEEGAGNLNVLVRYSTTSGNDGGDIGIEAVQEAPGTGTLRVEASSISETGDDDGIETDGVTEIL